VTPAVAAVGRIGCWPVIGRAAANSCGVTGRAAAWIGRDPTIAAAGTEVAAARLTYLSIVTLLMVVMFVTCVTFTCRI
jgi:hypothetical protein